MSTGSSEFVAAPESGQALPQSPSSVSRVQVAPCLFVVVCMFCYLFCMSMHVALRMWLSSDGLVCTTNSCRIAAQPPLPSQRSVCAWFISCCLHVSSVDLACMHVNAVCSAHAVDFWQVVFHKLRLTSFQQCHCWMDIAAPLPSYPTLLFTSNAVAWAQRSFLHSDRVFGDVYTTLQSTFVVVLVGVLVFCVPIPISHYSVLFSSSTSAWQLWVGRRGDSDGGFANGDLLLLQYVYASF